MKHFTYLALATTLLTAVSCKDKKQADTMSGDIIPVQVMPLAQEAMQQTVYASGQFTTDDEAILSFKNGGVISRIYVEEGDAVRQGQVLASLDKTEINSMSQQAKIALQKAERDYERALNLYQDSVATLEQMQNAKTALEIARQQYVGANFNSNTSEIRANQSGYVLKKFASEGQVVGAGTPVLQINGAANGNWIIKAGVSDNQWSAIALGDPAKIFTDALPDRIFNGKVIRKSEGIDPMTGTFTIQVQITDEDKKGLAAGLFGKVEIQAARTTEAWSVPFEALLDGGRNNGYVFISNDGKTVQKREVGILRIENKKAVIGYGLDSVRYLIVNGNAYLTDGSRIKIVNNK